MVDKGILKKGQVLIELSKFTKQIEGYKDPGDQAKKQIKELDSLDLKSIRVLNRLLQKLMKKIKEALKEKGKKQDNPRELLAQCVKEALASVFAPKTTSTQFYGQL